MVKLMLHHFRGCVRKRRAGGCDLLRRGMIAERARFIRENTRLQSPPHAPEVVLHMADEITPIWQLTEEELAERGLPPPFWAFAWAGGQALARYILDHPAEVAGKACLDLATGSGLVAIAAMKAGAARVTAYDVDDDVFAIGTRALAGARAWATTTCLNVDGDWVCDSG